MAGHDEEKIILPFYVTNHSAIMVDASWSQTRDKWDLPALSSISRPLILSVADKFEWLTLAVLIRSKIFRRNLHRQYYVDSRVFLSHGVVGQCRRRNIICPSRGKVSFFLRICEYKKSQINRRAWLLTRRYGRLFSGDGTYISGGRHFCARSHY